MIINLTQMRIWKTNPHLPKPIPAGFPCIWMPIGSHREMCSSNQDTLSSSLQVGHSSPLAMHRSPAALGKPPGVERGIFPTSGHLFGPYSALAWGTLPTYSTG